MSIINKPISLIGMLFFLLSFQLKASTLETLHHADELKSSDSQKFSQILSEIEPEFDSLGIYEKYYYLYLTGYRAAYSGDITKAISIYQHVAENSQDAELRFKTSFSLVNLFALRRDWLNGYRYLENISKLNESVSDLSVRHQGLIVASVFYNELEQYDMTQTYVNRLFTEQVSGRNLCLTYNVKLKADLATQEFKLLEEDIDKAIKACLDVNESVLVNILRSYLASYYSVEEQWEKVIALLEEHYTEIQASNYRLLRIETDRLLAEAYFHKENYELAEKFALAVINIQGSSEYLKPLLSNYKLLSLIAKKTNNFDAAFEYQNKYIEYKEFLFEDIKAKQLAIESAKHLSREKDNQIQLLNKQNQILQLEKELSSETASLNRWIIILLGISVSILILWTFYVKRSQQKLKYLAEFDGLTGISNRAFFTKSAETVLNYFAKTNRAASMILFDLDHFKKINDSYGHAMGDKVLKASADACKTVIRKVDVFGRIGGEEFAILLPGCEIEKAINIAEQCRESLTRINLSDSGVKIDVSASFGVSDTNNSGYLLKDILAHADESMYLAKRRGRNQVVIYKSSI